MSIVQIASNNFEEKLKPMLTQLQGNFSSILVENMIGPAESFATHDNKSILEYTVFYDYY